MALGRDLETVAYHHTDKIRTGLRQACKAPRYMGAATAISSPLETRQTLERRSDLFALMSRATRISGAVLHEGGYVR